jgi:hypothetical protein
MMIDPKAIVSTRWEPKSKKNIPNIVIVMTNEGISAVGEDGTNSGAYADMISEKFKGADEKALKAGYEDLIESFERTVHGHGYGGTTEIVNYVGAEKTRVDKIRDKLVTQKVKKSIS